MQIGPDHVSNLYSASGHPVDAAALNDLCSTDPRTFVPEKVQSCMVAHHLRTLLEYQPASRIPAFHAILATGYVCLGAAALLTVWLTVRRTTLTAG